MAVSPYDGGTTTPAVGFYEYDSNTVVSITATPASGYRFVNWTGNVENSNNASTTVTVNGILLVTANFQVNRSPSIVSISNKSVNENELFTLQVVANDPDGDALTYSLTEYSEGMAISATGKISWTPDYTQSGDHPVTVKVTDGRGGEATEGFTLTVIDVNRAPSITALTNGSVNENELFTLQVVANDPDGDALTYSLTEFPEGMAISATGTINWAPDYTQSGDHPVTVKVTDGRGGETTESFTLTVIDVPYEYCVNNPFPNPFNHGTTIEYSLPEETHVLITIYNISGQAVCVLKDEVQSTGYYSIKWSAKDMPSGQYICNLKTKKFTKTKKMLLLK